MINGENTYLCYMSDKYKKHEPIKAYFITMTTVGCNE